MLFRNKKQQQTAYEDEDARGVGESDCHEQSLDSFFPKTFVFNTTADMRLFSTHVNQLLQDPAYDGENFLFKPNGKGAVKKKTQKRFLFFFSGLLAGTHTHTPFPSPLNKKKKYRYCFFK